MQQQKTSSYSEPLLVLHTHEWTRDGERKIAHKVIGYDETTGKAVTRKQAPRVLRWKYDQQEITSLDDAARVIKALANHPHSILVHGCTAPYVDMSAPNFRRSIDKPGEPAPLKDFPRHLWIFDIDGMKVSDAWLDECPEDAIQVMLGTYFPAEMMTRCYWQLSNTAGLNGTTDTVKCHLVFWLEEPRTAAQMAKWGKKINAEYKIRVGKEKAKNIVDTAVFRPAQPIYTANPTFIQGAVDPLPVRHGWFEPDNGKTTLFVPLIEQAEIPRFINGTDTRIESLADALNLIGDDKDGYHEPIKQAVVQYFRDNTAPRFEVFAQAVREAIDSANHGNRSIDELEHRKGEEHLRGLFDWAASCDFTKRAQIIDFEKPIVPVQATPRQPAAKAAKKMREFIADVVENARPGTVYIANGDAGLGKTTGLVQAIKDIIAKRPIAGLNVEIYSLTNRLAADTAAQFDGSHVKARHFNGRVRSKSEKESKAPKRCLKETAVDRTAPHQIKAAHCVRKLDNDTLEKCPFYDSCAYNAQYRDTIKDCVSVAVYPHSALNNPRKRVFANVKPDLIVIDENFSDQGAIISRMPLGLVRDVFKDIEPSFYRVMNAFVDALEAGQPSITAFKDAVEDANATLKAMRKKLGEMFPDVIPFSPSMGENDLAAILESPLPSTPFGKIKGLLKAIERELHHETCNAVRVETKRLDDGEHKSLVVCRNTSLRRLDPEIPVLILDANANADIIGKMLDRPVIAKEFRAELKAEIIQVHDSAMSNHTLFGNNAKRMFDAAMIAKREAAFGADTLLCAPKKGFEQLAEHHKALSFDNLATEHFGALRGVDDHKNAETIVVVGRNQPPTQGTLDKARALFADRNDIDLTTDELIIEQRQGVGTCQPVNVQRFADDTIQALLELDREGEIEQAVARLRLVHRYQAAKVIIVSNVPTSIPVDHHVKFSELEVNALDTVFIRHGVVPMGATDLSALAPDLFSSRDRAKEFLNAAETFTPKNALTERSPVLDIHKGGTAQLDQKWGRIIQTTTGTATIDVVVSANHTDEGAIAYLNQKTGRDIRLKAATTKPAKTTIADDCLTKWGFIAKSTAALAAFGLIPDTDKKKAERVLARTDFDGMVRLSVKAPGVKRAFDCYFSPETKVLDRFSAMYAVFGDDIEVSGGEIKEVMPERPTLEGPNVVLPDLPRTPDIGKWSGIGKFRKRGITVTPSETGIRFNLPSGKSFKAPKYIYDDSIAA